MPAIVDADPQLLATLGALGDYLEDLVLVGGWVPHLYRKMWPSESPVEARRTFDLDAAVGGSLPTRHGPRLDVLLTDRGYIRTLGGVSGPAVQSYDSPVNSGLLPIEFLTPLTGSHEETTVEIQKGVTAQALRYLNILLENTMEVRLSGEAVEASTGELTVRIPIPGAYVFHRGLIAPRGGSRRRGKDLYYIFETWASLPDQKDRIVEEIVEIRTRYPSGWYRRFRANLKSLFSHTGARGVLLVFEQYVAEEPVETAHQRIYQAFRALLDSLPEQ